MATSSILTNFTITDKEAAERFVKALEEASKQPPRKFKSPPVEDITDPEVIRKFFLKDKKQ